MSKPKPKPQRSTKLLVGIWVSAGLSLGLLYQACVAVSSDISGFRSCNTNSSGLSVSSCGKQSLNFGDIVLFILFVASAALAASLFTAAWRMTRRTNR